MFYWLYKTRISGRSYSSTTDNLLDCYTNRTEQHLDINLLGLDETSSVPYNSGKTQTYIHIFLLFHRDRLWRNPRKRVAGGGKL